VTAALLLRLTRAVGGARAALALCAAASAGCSGGLGPGYLKQAAQGQWSLIQARRPLAEAMVDPSLPARTRAVLAEVPAVKRFGEEQGLRPTGSYTEFVKVDGPAVVWVVSACEPLAFRPRQWSFPLVGSFTYVGWFDRSRAEDHGADLRADGLDAYVRGSVAYSTLGWFRDPVVSTMLPAGDHAAGALFDTVLHESVHATYYVNSQSYLNESLASFVAGKLTPTYLLQTRGPQSPELLAYLASERDGERREEGLHLAYQALEKLYAAPIGDAEKLAEKARIMRDTRARFGITRPLNNAMLIQYRTYNIGRAEFEALLAACGQSWPRFWAAMRTLRPTSFTRPQQEDLAPALTPLARAGCPAG
jgi:predicted aminopeptidase